MNGIDETNWAYSGALTSYVNKAYNAGKRTRESLEAEAGEVSRRMSESVVPLRETEGKKVDIYA